MNQPSNLAQPEEVVQLNFRIPKSLDKRLSQAALDNETNKTEIVREGIEVRLDQLQTKSRSKGGGARESK